MVLDWEEDPSKPNPYVSLITHASQNDIKNQLLEEEKKELAAGVPHVHSTGPTAFISMGLLIEENQRRIAWDARGPEALMVHRDNELQQRRLVLMHQLKQFHNLQDVYTPAAAVMLAQAEEAQQHLPAPAAVASLCPSGQSSHSQLPGRFGQHRNKATASTMPGCTREDSDSSTRNIRGQNPNTRATDTISHIEDKCKALAVKYHATRQALLELIGPGDWERELKELNDGDLTTPDGTEISIEIPNDEIGPDGCLLSKKRLNDGLNEVRQAGIQRDIHARFTHLWDQPLVPFTRDEDSGEGSATVLDPAVEAFFEDDD
ncbi:uncharacterized protein LACBIDRAFT_333719 [Laccaria bicolor S238N-H82]|uniref:Predicted protein n=1 Tax=Laccaria bicolor (strain S238N-H82 / ATCC MYA-4686) TaxID=486041 RepID=B0DWV2_LACBS|nr:uncharacterized protein LACBIDRAFT_333719 [Laccaria bicolor S238N-H82]EDR00876.1 predicted protein [Laccaria bicolor S238N-H82]|eukprot:XP_001888470.1 predicted protein [Laccaria bicolor S238N-H82]